MPREFASVEEMLAPYALEELVGQTVRRVSLAPMEAPHLSGSSIERVLVETRTGSYSLVLKRYSPERDWVMRLTHDDAVREAALYRHGVFERLPETCSVPIIAVARSGGTWASLMRDVSDALTTSNQPSASTEEVRFWVEQLAAIHARFYGDSSLLDPMLGLSSLEDFVAILSPATVQRERNAWRANPVLEAAAKGWEDFFKIAPRDVVEQVQLWQTRPRPLVAALRQMRCTLLHGDFKMGNLGIMGLEGARRLVLIDWQDAAYGPPALDLGYFLAVNGRKCPIARDEVVETYLAALRARGVEITPAELDLSLAAGGALRLLWQIAAFAANASANQSFILSAELEWWHEVVRRAATALGSYR